jgi:DNA-binding NarL/FixJ family response regulator
MAPTVLIVDDHQGFRSLARALLESEGFEVVGDVAGGLAAVAAATNLRPDVVLLDVQLPDIDGFEVAERLRAAFGDAGPSVVLISSRDAVVYGPRVSASGAVGFLAKADLSGPALQELLAGRQEVPA